MNRHVVAGMVGVLAAPLITLDTQDLPLLVVPALAAALLAGFTSPVRACIAGLLLGVAQSLIYYASAQTWFPQSGGEAVPGSYVKVPLSAENRIRLTLPMLVERIESHPHVLGNLGRVALRRGPLVFCIEQADHAGADVWDIALPADAELTPEFMPDLLGGVTILRCQAVAQDLEADTPLYRTARPGRLSKPVTLTAIPYYAWANREAGPMQVWIPEA